VPAAWLSCDDSGSGRATDRKRHADARPVGFHQRKLSPRSCRLVAVRPRRLGVQSSRSCFGTVIKPTSSEKFSLAHGRCSLAGSRSKTLFLYMRWPRQRRRGAHSGNTFAQIHQRPVDYGKVHLDILAGREESGDNPAAAIHHVSDGTALSRTGGALSDDTAISVARRPLKTSCPTRQHGRAAGSTGGFLRRDLKHAGAALHSGYRIDPPIPSADQVKRINGVPTS